MPDTVDNIIDIDETDPKKILIAIDNLARPSIGDQPDSGDIEAIRRYWGIINHACKKFGLAFSVERPDDESWPTAKATFAATKATIDRLKIDLLYDKVSTEIGGKFDETWRTKIHSYLAAIRGIVEASGVEDGLRQKILDRLNNLADAVDTYRVPSQVFGDAFVAICEGLNRGSKKLEPAVRLLERVAGAVERLRGTKRETLALPKPEDFGLPDEPSSASASDSPKG